MYHSSERGFSLIQTLIAFTIIILLVTSIVPSIVLIKKEQEILKLRLTAAHKIHDILIKEIGEESSTNKTGKNNFMQYRIIYKKDLIEVCGTWTNIKKAQENRCYYGKKERM